MVPLLPWVSSVSWVTFTIFEGYQMAKTVPSLRAFQVLERDGYRPNEPVRGSEEAEQHLQHLDRELLSGKTSQLEGKKGVEVELNLFIITTSYINVFVIALLQLYYCNTCSLFKLLFR